MRYCELVNFETGRRISGKSVIEFCQKAGLTAENDVIHIYPILRGERLHHKNWGLPQYYNYPISLKDIYGNLYKGQLRDFLLKYKVSVHVIWSLVRRKKLIVSGLMLSDTETNFIPPKTYKVERYEFISPNGKVVSGKTLSGISRMLGNSVTQKSLSKLIHGYAQHPKGYRIKYIYTSDRKVLQG
jgi:hypothetical protein